MSAPKTLKRDGEQMFRNVQRVHPGLPEIEAKESAVRACFQNIGIHAAFGDWPDTFKVEVFRVRVYEDGDWNSVAECIVYVRLDN